MNLPRQFTHPHESVARNISAGGILFESSRPVQKGEVLKLEIELREWSRRLGEAVSDQYDDLPLKLLGEVVHCEEVTSGSVYHIGVKFVGLDPKYQKAILQYLRDSFEKA